MSAPAFSAVVPAYNAAATVGDAIRSVLAQSQDDLELIVVDDGSSDATAEIVDSFEDPRMRLLRQANTGPGGARNTGVAAARGRYVGFLDADDLWMPRFLEVLGAALDAQPGAGFAYTDGWTLDERTRAVRRTTTMSRLRPPRRPPHTPDEMLRLLVRGNFIPCEALVRRSAIEAVGGFEPSLRHSEDYDLWLRLLAAGHAAVRPPGLLFVRRDLPSSASREPLLAYRALGEVMRRVAEEYDVPPDVRIAARERRTWAEDQARRLTRADPASRARRWLRGAAGGLKRRALRRRVWHRRPPRELLDAFPELWEP